MKYFECDFCKVSFIAQPKVVLNGVTGSSSGILLPEQFHVKHFCKTDCFWNWIHKYDPINLEKKSI